MSEQDISVIAENLTELLQNTVNMTSVYYDIFLNPEPQKVKITQFDNNNELKTIEIPNRAMDRQIALSGSGSPEGQKEANVGATYVDTQNQAVYFKTSGTGNTGWTLVLTQADVNSAVETYVDGKDFVTNTGLSNYLSVNEYTTQTEVSDMLEQYNPIIAMTSISSASGSIQLNDNSAYAITAIGNTTFALPAVTDLTKMHKIFVQLRMDSPYTINLGATKYFDKITPSMSVAGRYNIMYEYDNTHGTWTDGIVANSGWVVGAMVKGA